MKICYKCILKEGLRIEQPQMLISYRGCDCCGKKWISSFNKEEVDKQIIREKDRT
jgi:hypothetical protein